MITYTLAGFFLVPYLIKRQTTRFARESLKCLLVMEEVRVNPYAYLSVDAGDFNVAGKVSYGEGEKGPNLQFSGDAHIADLLVSESDTKQRLLAWQAFLGVGSAAQKPMSQTWKTAFTPSVSHFT